MLTGYFKYVLLLLPTAVVTINSTQVNSTTTTNQSTIQESVKILSAAKTLSAFAREFSKIDFKDVFTTNKSEDSVSWLMKYDKEYISAVGETENIVDFVDMENLMTETHSEVDLDKETFLKLVLQNLDALKSLNSHVWSSAAQLNDGDGIIYLAGLPNGISVECGTNFVEYFGKVLTNNDTSFLFGLQNIQTALKSPAGQMIDSWGKISPRVLIGTQVNWLGAFDQCSVLPYAKYCAVDMVVMKKYPGLYGTCMPKQCTEHDVGSIYQSIFNRQIDMVKYLGVGHVNCVDEKIEYSNGFIATICLCSVLLLLVFLGTLTDVIDEQITTFRNKYDTRKDGIENAAEVRINEYVSESKENCHVVTSPKVATIHVEKKTSAEPKPKKKPLIIRILLCFSLVRNTKAVMSTEVPKGAIEALNGIRAISMFWVILGHLFLFTTMIKNYDNNKVSMLRFLKTFPAQVVTNAFVSVDTFFLLSGVLMTYLALRQMDKRNGRMNIPLYYLHRFIRITPPYMFVVLIWTNVYPYMFTGPLAKQTRVTGDGGNCAKYWWTNMFYINNFYPEEMGETVKDKTCMGWSWYLANDMQFSIIAPFIIYAFYFFEKRLKNSRFVHAGAFTITLVCCLATVLIRMILLIVHNYPGLVITMQFHDHPFNNDGRQDNLYVKPYTRFSPYIIGMLLGYIFSRKIELPSKSKRVLVSIIWLVAFVLGYCIVLAPYFSAYQNSGQHFSQTENVMYGSLSAFTWALIVAWVLYACHNGFAGMINKILSWRFWIPLSRLTFGAYLLHPLVIFYFFLVHENPFHFQENLLAFAYVAILVFSFGMAFILSMAVEYPVINLEKLLFKQ